MQLERRNIINDDELQKLLIKQDKLNDLYKEFYYNKFVNDLSLKEYLNDILGQIDVCLKRIDERNY